MTLYVTLKNNSNIVLYLNEIKMPIFGYEDDNFIRIYLDVRKAYTRSTVIITERLVTLEQLQMILLCPTEDSMEVMVKHCLTIGVYVDG